MISITIWKNPDKEEKVSFFSTLEEAVAFARATAQKQSQHPNHLDEELIEEMHKAKRFCYIGSSCEGNNLWIMKKEEDAE